MSNKKLIAFFIAMALCFSAYALEPATTTYLESPAAISDVYAIVEREYGQTVDKMTIFVSGAFGVLSLVFVGSISFIWWERRKYIALRKNLSTKLKSLKAQLTDAEEKISGLLSGFADVISLSITEGDKKSQSVLDDVPGTSAKTREVMSKMQLIEKCRDLTEDEQFTRGLNFYCASDFSSAADTFIKLVDCSSSEEILFWSLFNLAACYCRLQDNEKALNSIERALKIRPDSIKAMLMKATILTMLNNIDDAYELFNYVLNNKSIDFRKYGNEFTNFVTLLLRKNQLDDADCFIEKLNAKGVSNHVLDYNKICLKAKRGDTSEDLAYELVNLLRQSPDLAITALSDSDLYKLFSQNDTVAEFIRSLTK